MSYNGYKNYETWCVALWVDNDEYTQNYWAELADEAWADNYDEGDDPESSSADARYQLANCYKELILDGNPLAGDASLYADILAAALRDVCWCDLADNALSDIDDYVPHHKEPAQ